MSPVTVDCRGVKILLDEIVCDIEGQTWRFVIAPERKRGERFHLGTFFNQAAYSRDVDGYPRDRRVCALLESPISGCYRNIDELVRRFPVIFTHQQDLLKRGEPFVPLLYGTNWLSVRSEQDTRRIADTHPEKSRLVSFIGNINHPTSNAYQFRREVADYALSRGDVDCYGRGIRETPGKWEAIAPYRFSIAMENAASDHYFSEKLIDCVLLEAVPIYYGCPGIGEFLDTRGMLVFETVAELAAILDSLSPELYDSMRPFALANKQTVIENRWESHHGLFTRIARSLPTRFELSDGVPYPSRMSLRRFVDRLLLRLPG